MPENAEIVIFANSDESKAASQSGMVLDNFDLNEREIKEIVPCNAAVSNKESYMDVTMDTNVTGWRSIFVNKDDISYIEMNGRG